LISQSLGYAGFGGELPLAHLTGALPQSLHLIGREGLWDYARITGKPSLLVRRRVADNSLGTFKKEAIELLAESCGRLAETGIWLTSEGRQMRVNLFCFWGMRHSPLLVLPPELTGAGILLRGVDVVPGQRSFIASVVGAAVGNPCPLLYTDPMRAMPN
jgi:hypothetical protein